MTLVPFTSFGRFGSTDKKSLCIVHCCTGFCFLSFVLSWHLLQGKFWCHICFCPCLCNFFHLQGPSWWKDKGGAFSEGGACVLSFPISLSFIWSCLSICHSICKPFHIQHKVLPGGTLWIMERLFLCLWRTGLCNSVPNFVVLSVFVFSRNKVFQIQYKVPPGGTLWKEGPTQSHSMVFDSLQSTSTQHHKWEKSKNCSIIIIFPGWPGDVGGAWYNKNLEMSSQHQHENHHQESWSLIILRVFARELRTPGARGKSTWSTTTAVVTLCCCGFCVKQGFDLWGDLCATK